MKISRELKMFSKTLIFVFISLVLGDREDWAASPYSDPHFVGDRRVIVQLMEWKYSEIAKECEVFLGPYGYGGVLVSPVSENAILPRREWWERYQPVSYKICTRSGNEDQFRDMIQRCNKVGVRIYVDAVLNHMTWAEVGVGTAGSNYNGIYEDYPGVPYSSLDFHGHESCCNADLEIHNNSDPIEVRNCQFLGLRDLNQGKEWVREKQADFLNRLIDIGVAGFRGDAAKYQWPGDLENIISRLHCLNTAFFEPNLLPFWYHEVTTDPVIQPTEYTDIGRVIEFKYYEDLALVLRKRDGQRLKYLKNFYGWDTPDKGWNMLPTYDAFVMVDNPDLQRGHIGSLDINIAYYESTLLKMATAFMLAWPYGVPQIMSSYYWIRDVDWYTLKDRNDWMGPPHDSHQNILGVQRNADLTCDETVWICEHRWRQIYNMVRFRNVAADEKVCNWWDNDYHSIAFSRGNKAFIAINNDIQPIDCRLMTGLPPGKYCDIISGNLKGGKCTGRTITVNSDGTADIFVDNNWEDPMIAFHIKSCIHSRPSIQKSPKLKLPKSSNSNSSITKSPNPNSPNQNTLITNSPNTSSPNPNLPITISPNPNSPNQNSPITKSPNPKSPNPKSPIPKSPTHKPQTDYLQAKV